MAVHTWFTRILLPRYADLEKIAEKQLPESSIWVSKVLKRNGMRSFRRVGEPELLKFLYTGGILFLACKIISFYSGDLNTTLELLDEI